MSSTLRILGCLALATAACTADPPVSPTLSLDSATDPADAAALADADAAATTDTAAPGDTAPETAAVADTATADAAAADAPTGGTIAIYMKGEHDPKPFADGLSGQTPSGYQVAISRYAALKSADDPAPQPCFDHGTKATVADLKGDNLMGTCATAKMASGTYTHGRVKLDWSRYTVQGNLHYNGVTLPGSFTFLRAWSDTTVDGKAFQAGTGTLRFQDKTGVVANEVPYTYPPLPALPGITTQTVAGEFLMTFAYKKPLPIVQGAPGQHWARFHWHVLDGFRWQDAGGLAFSPGVWDVSPPPGVTETVVFAGATAYFVTSSVD